MNAPAVPNRWIFDDTRRTKARATQIKAATMPRALTETELDQAVRSALPMLHRMAGRLAADQETAEEAVQDALLKVARSWKSFRGESSLETWLCQIVIYSVRDQIKKRSRGQRQNIADAHDMADTRRGPAQQTIASERNQRIQAAIRELPDRQREVLTLVVWEGNRPAEVAELLGLSAENVHANLHEARKKMRNLLRDELA